MYPAPKARLAGANWKLVAPLMVCSATLFRSYNNEITVLGSMAVLNSFGAAADLMAVGA